MAWWSCFKIGKFNTFHFVHNNRFTFQEIIISPKKFSKRKELLDKSRFRCSAPLGKTWDDICHVQRKSYFLVVINLITPSKTHKWPALLNPHHPVLTAAVEKVLKYWKIAAAEKSVQRMLDGSCRTRTDSDSYWSFSRSGFREDKSSEKKCILPQ